MKVGDKLFLVRLHWDVEEWTIEEYVVAGMTNVYAFIAPVSGKAKRNFRIGRDSIDVDSAAFGGNHFTSRVGALEAFMNRASRVEKKAQEQQSQADRMRA